MLAYVMLFTKMLKPDVLNSHTDFVLPFLHSCLFWKKSKIQSLTLQNTEVSQCSAEKTQSKTAFMLWHAPSTVCNLQRETSLCPYLSVVWALSELSSSGTDVSLLVLYNLIILFAGPFSSCVFQFIPHLQLLSNIGYICQYFCHNLP